jgi:hypothetical protein
MATNNPQTVKIVALLFKLVGVLPFLVGLGLFAGAAFTANRQYTIINKWPTVDAQVARSELASHRHTFAHDSSPTTVYQAQIDFQYTLGGKPYTTPCGRDYSTSDYAEMKRKVDAYAPGSHHAIRYNPTNPNDVRYDAAYTFGFFLTPLILGGAALMTASAGAVMFLIGWFLGRTIVRCPSCNQMVGRTGLNCPNCGAPLSQPGA